MTATHEDTAGPKALVVIPQSVNYFYNQSGRRAAEALTALGWRADVRGLGEWAGEPYDWCLVSNLAEVLHGYGDQDRGLDRVRELAAACGGVACLGIDCANTPWFRHLNNLCKLAGIKTFLDIGFTDQSAEVAAEYRAAYRFVFSGLTPSEAPQARAACARDDADRRPFPWAFVAHGTPQRAALVDFLLQAVDPGGFVYVPSLAPYKEKGSPHLNQQQYEAVLRRTRYQVWCSHHDHFYMEPERFRTSLLTGSVPVKVVESAAGVPTDAPFRYLVMEPRDVPGRLTPELFARVRRTFCQDFLDRPTLADELARVLSELGVWSGPLPRAAAPRGTEATTRRVA